MINIEIWLVIDFTSFQKFAYATNEIASEKKVYL